MTFACVFLNWRLCCDFWVCVFELAWMLWLLRLCFLIGVCVLHLWATVARSWSGLLSAIISHFGTLILWHIGMTRQYDVQ